ncbi:molybdopterin-dependent oxidoreductase [Vibrio sp. WJH972]
MSSDKSTQTHKFVTSNHWGAAIAEVKDDKLVAIHPHRGDNDPSKINDNLVGMADSESRVRKPAVRKSYLEHGPMPGATPRGEDPFIEVSWEVAFDLIAKEISRVRSEYSNEAIFGGSYGWSSAGRFHHAQSQLKRFLNCAGGFIRSEGNYSYNAALTLLPYIVGNFRQHVKHATRWKSIAKHGELVVMFGGIPMRNAQVGGGGMSKHRLRDDLLACKDSGVEFINLSPLKNDALEDLDAQWIPIKPGSDTALMMGIAHTLLIEELHDQAFLDRYTTGFDHFRRYLIGESDSIVKSAEWAAELCGISSEDITSLARRMAGSKTLICAAVGLQRAEYGEQPLWMTVTLSSMLGQIGTPGGGYGIGYGGDASIGTTDRPMRWPSFPQGNNPIETFIPVAMITDMLLNPKQSYQYNGQTLSYPDIKLIWWAGGNPFHHHQDLNQLLKAFQRPETIIVNEIYWTATAKHADIVLPATSPLEREDFGGGTQDTSLVPMPRVLKPIGEAKDEYDIYAELSSRLGFEEHFTQGRSSREWLEKMWLEMQETASQSNYSLPTFTEFLKGDVIEFDDPSPEHVFLADFREDPLDNRLPTPSGKIEIYSEIIASFNYYDCPGHPTWLPPTEWLGSDISTTHKFHLISGQPATRLHSQLDPGEYSKSKKIHDREPVLIHPDNAKKLGIEHGDIVKLHNDRGACLAGAVVTNRILKDVIFLWTGAWYDPEKPGTIGSMDKHGNPNMLTHDRRTSRLSQGCAAHSTLVSIEKYVGVAPSVTAFKAPLSRYQR